MNLVTLVGGGADYVCNNCLPEARTERTHSLVGIADIDDPDVRCVYCDYTAGEVAQ